METLNSIMFEKFMDGEISMDSYEKMLTILCESSVSDDELMNVYKDTHSKLKIISTQVKKEIAASKFKDASKHLDDMNKVIDDSITILKNIDTDSGDSNVAKIVMNALPSAVYGAALTLLSAVSRDKIFTAAIGGLTLIDLLTSVVSDLKELKTTGDVTSAKIKNMIKTIVSFKAVVRKLSSALASKKLEAELMSSDLSESTVDDASDVITNLYIEGTIDDETYIDLMTESDDEDDATKCYDKAIEILTKLKEKPGDKKLTEKLKDVLDDCCECDEKDDKKEDEKAEEKKDDDDEAEEAEAPAEEEEVAEESTIVIESEDPVVAEIMESVESMVADLDYASAIMESDLMMTESTDVLKSVMTDVKARLAGVGNMLKELKAKVVDVSDNSARAKIAKILNDLAKRFTALAGTAKEKIAGLANASKKTPDAPNA